MRYKQKLIFLKSRKVVPEGEGIISGGQLKKILLEIFLILLQPYPCLTEHHITFTDQTIKITYSYNANDIFYILMLVRLHLLFRAILAKTQYYSVRAQRLW
mgnify:CR=1 FL=1